MIEYIKSTTLSFPDLWTHFGMSKDDVGRWETTSNTPDWVIEYLSDYRKPSRAWPLSHVKALLSQKFAKLLVSRDPELAIKTGVGQLVKTDK